MPKPEKDVRLDRHSGSGSRGLAKKDGAGKYGWGKAGTGEDGQGIIDAHDPNYLSEEEEENVIITKTEVASPVEVIIREFFESGDEEETRKGLQEFVVPERVQFVKKSLTFALEKSAYERELISRLLSSFYEKGLAADDIFDGFEIALNALEDLVLDTPDATEVLSKFLARAVVDEIIPPAFFKNAKLSSKKAEEAIALAGRLVSEKHGSERLANVWGPGALHSVKRLKEEISTILAEYLVIGDKVEADKCVRTLNAPSFHWQIVKQAIRFALEKSDAERARLAELLSFFSENGTGLISRDHMIKGFKISFGILADIKLDIPRADILLQEFTQKAKSEGWLPNDFTN